ncbi:MAG: SseB family protein [Paracoccaceae bacterium]|nr:SseB family protein [Paracoccaceae bacterium]
MTPLDDAHAATQAAPEDEARLLRYYAILAETELYLLLEREADGGRADPVTVDPGIGPVALAFDLELRLAGFAGAPSPYLALPGREAARLLAGSGLGLALNLDEVSETILDTETLAWLAGVEAETEAGEARPSEVQGPRGVPADLLEAIDRKLAMAAGRASHAVLVDAVYADGGSGHLLAVFDCAPDARGQLAAAIGEAMAFQGFGAGWLDVTFLNAGSDIAARIERVGLRFDLPDAVRPTPPGSDPDKPPRLR